MGQVVSFFRFQLHALNLKTNELLHQSHVLIDMTMDRLRDSRPQRIATIASGDRSKIGDPGPPGDPVVQPLEGEDQKPPR
jgi:hypothetical protein